MLLKKIKKIDLKSIISYTFFGFISSLINIVIFQYLYHQLKIINLVSNTIAFLISNIFSYLCNRKFVFKTIKGNIKELTIEFGFFLSSRLISYFLDIIFMFICVVFFKLNSANQTLILKIIDQILLGLLNYFLSIIIFKRSEKRITRKIKQKD